MPQLAFDRASVRFLDEDGRLRVGMSNMSKACVNPYYGREIPKNDELGLDPDKIYLLLRDPEELAKGIATLNNVPVLSIHAHQKASDPQREYVVGATGSDAVYVHPYARNSMVVWDQEAINGVTSEEKSQLSSSYHFDADMTGGDFEGTHFDGVMRNIRFNHVALVPVGRAGPDVVVGDSQFLELIDMKKTRTAVAVQAALGAYLKPKLAADAALGDMASLLGSVTQGNVKKTAPRIAKDLAARLKTKLAADMEIAPEELAEVIVAASEEVIDDVPAEDPAKPAGDDTSESVAKVIAMLEGKLSAEELATIKDLLGVEGDPTPAVAGDDKDSVPKAAMDAAIKAAATSAETAAVKRMQDLRQAEKDVQPLVGEVVAMDSAEAVYRYALEQADVDLDGVPPAAFGAMVRMLPRPGAATTTPRIAADSALSVVASFNKRFPNAVAPARS